MGNAFRGDIAGILLIHAPHDFGWPWGMGNANRGYYEYLGIGYLAAACKEAGIPVQILDAPYFNWDPNRTYAEIQKRNFDVLGISANWQEFFPHASRLLEKLEATKTPVILGGHFPSIAHREVLSDSPAVTAVCVGEGEKTVVEAIQALGGGNSLLQIPGLALRSSNGADDILRTPPRPLETDLDSLPFPLRPHAEIYRKDKSPGLAAANILSSRGCGGDCSFCTIHAFQSLSPGPRWRARSPENLLDEVEKLQKDYGFAHFRLVDEDFLGRSPLGRARAERIASEVARRKIEMKFEMFCRADEVDPDILKCLKEAGLSAVYLSLDAVSEEDLETYNKGTTRQQMIDAVRYVVDSGVQLAYSFIFWHPYRRMTDFRQAFALLDAASDGDLHRYRTVLKGMQTGIISDLVVLTGSPIEKRIREDGLLHGNYRKYSYRFVHRSTAAAYSLMKAYKGVCSTAKTLSNSIFGPR